MTLNRLLTVSLLAALALAPVQPKAAVIGRNQATQPLTPARVLEMPAEQRPVWLHYLQRSAAQRSADQAVLAAERAGLVAQGQEIPQAPPNGNAEKSMPLREAKAWYRSAEALRVADNIVSFQTPAGGWGKNQARDGEPRRPGQDFVPDNNSKRSLPGDFDRAEDPRWAYVGTIDNDATVTEIRFLAKVAAQLEGRPEQAKAYQQSALKGLLYLLQAQFPNGAWPQVWPLQGGYHDAVTLNDNALVQVATLMGAAARGEQEFAFLPEALRAQALASEGRAIECLLATQLRIQGRKTLWAQQYDALSLQPTSARNYEPAAISSFESADVLVYLMSLSSPTPAVVDAVQQGVHALQALAITGQAWRNEDGVEGRSLVADPAASPLWARFYSLDRMQPIFADRDKSIHDSVSTISRERRNGYAWYGNGPLKALTSYRRWQARTVP